MPYGSVKAELYPEIRIILRNRLVMAPMNAQLSAGGRVTEKDVEFYRERSQSVGLSIIGSGYVSASGNSGFGAVSCASDDAIEGLSQLAQAIHSGGSRAILQLVHAGRMTNRFVTAGHDVVAPSAIQAKHGQVDIPRELTRDEIIQIMQDFVDATRRAIQAGFDGVEIHGANTFLCQQFMSPASNQRDDEFGGPLVNRIQFPAILTRLVVQEANAANRPFAVGYRISPEEAEPGGLTLEDNLFLMQILERLGIDYLSLSLHHYDQRPQTSSRLATWTVADIVKSTSQVPVMIAGHIRTKTDVATSNADLIGIATPIVSEPTWAQRLLND